MRILNQKQTGKNKLKNGTGREAESGLEKFVGGNNLDRMFPKGSRWAPGFPFPRE
jgi:hypothetical protein